MYLHLGSDVSIKTESIIGIFDLDSSSASKMTKEFLTKAQQNGQVKDISGELPKAFVLARENKKTTVYLAQVSSSTLLKRANMKSGGLSDLL